MINLKHFNSNLLRIDKKHYKGINIYTLGTSQLKKNDDCENIYSVNPSYLFVNHGIGDIKKRK